MGSLDVKSIVLIRNGRCVRLLAAASNTVAGDEALLACQRSATVDSEQCGRRWKTDANARKQWHTPRKSAFVRSGAAGVTLLAALGMVSTCQAASGHGDGGGHGDAEAAAEVDEAVAQKNAVALGEYRIRSYYPVQARKSIVQFVLYATSDEDHLAEAKQLVKNRQHKVRDQVITATRMVPLADFDEPDLSRFRRRILLRLRRMIPELTIKEIYVSQFEMKVKSL